MAFYFNYQKNFLLFSICGQKTVLLAPRKVIFGEFSFKPLYLPGWVLYPFKQNNRNTGLKTGKNKNGVATLGYNPRFPVL